MSRLLLVVGPQPSLVTLCRELANSVSMKSSRTFIPTPWEKKAHTKIKLFFIWLHLLQLSSLLILHFAQWKLSRLVSSICIQQCNQRLCLGSNPDIWLFFNLERLFPTNEGRRGNWNFLQRFETTLDETDSIHNDEIRLFRKDCCRSLWSCCTKTKRSMLKGNQFFFFSINDPVEWMFIVI